MKNLFTLLFLASFFQGISQTPLANLVLMDDITGGALSRTSLIAADHENNLIVGGTYFSQFTNSIAYEGDTLLSGVNLTPDIMILKLDSSGQFIWLKRIESSKEQVLAGLVVDKTGHIVLNFKCAATASYEGHTLAPGNTILKLDPDGAYEWHNTLTGMFAYQPNNMLTLDCLDNIITGGNISYHSTGVIIGWIPNGQDSIPMYQEAPDSIRLNGSVYPPAGEHNLVVIKFLPDGSLFWLKQFPAFAAMSEISAEFGSEIVFSGVLFADSIALDGVTLFKNDPAAIREYFYTKLSEDGTAQWAHSYFDTAYPLDVRMAPGGAVYFSTTFYQSTTYQSTTFQANGNWDELLVRLDSAGGYQWARTIGEPHTGLNSILNVNKRGDVAITGYSLNTGEFGRKFDAQGNLLWVNPDNGDSGNNGTGPVAFDPEGNMWLIGWYGGDFSMGPYEFSIWGGPTYTFLAKFSDQDISGPLYTCMQTETTPAVEVHREAPVRLFPNPAEGFVEVSGAVPFSKIRVFSTDGKRLADIEPPAGAAVHIDLGSFQPGLLFIESIDLQGRHSVQKCIKL